MRRRTVSLAILPLVVLLAAFFASFDIPTAHASGWEPGGGGNGITQLTGDVTAGPGPGSVAATVAKINGATVPASGGLTTGNVLRVTAASALAYGQLDLANANAVTGSLPAGNQAAQSMGGDVTGTTGSATVAKINGATAPAGGSLTTGNVLQVNGASSLTYSALNIGGGANYITGNLPVGNVASGTSGQVLMSNGSPATTWTTIGGDATVGATGTWTNTGASGAFAVTGKFTTSAGRVRNVVTKTGNYTGATTDEFVLMNCSSACSYTLPSPATAGQSILIKDISGAASTNNVTIARNAAEQIEGVAASKVMHANDFAIELTSDGTNWWQTWSASKVVTQTITSTTTFTPQGGIYTLKLTGCGGGGSGGSGGAAAVATAGGGGGAGAILQTYVVTVVPGTGYTVTVPAAATGGAGVSPTNTGNIGAVGGNLTFGSLATFPGASGGGPGSASTSHTSLGGSPGQGNGAANICAGAGQGGAQGPAGCQGPTASLFSHFIAGAGGAALSGSAGVAGARSLFSVNESGAGGSASTAGGGGGGGAGPFGAGGAGGNGSTTTPTAGSNGGTCAGGGGGGGLDAASGTSGGGGNGGTGEVIVEWVEFAIPAWAVAPANDNDHESREDAWEDTGT